MRKGEERILIQITRKGSKYFGLVLRHKNQKFSLSLEYQTCRLKSKWMSNNIHIL